MTVADAVRTDIELTGEERTILDRLILRVEELPSDPMRVRSNGNEVLALLSLLDARGAIREHRLRCFSDPDYHPCGRGRSLKEEFQGNGTCGDEIARHPHFLAVMRYFLCGPDLAARVKQDFAEAVEDFGGEITSSEVIAVGNTACIITRASRLSPRTASVEFFRLALEHGAHPMWAKHIYERVRALRVN